MRQCVPIPSTVASASAQLFRSAVRSQLCQPSRTWANDSDGIVEVDDVVLPGRERGKGQRGGHPEVAATAAAQRPEEIGVAVGRRGDGLPVGQHHRCRRQLVTERASMPGMGAQSAAQGVPRGTDRRAGAGRDTAAGRGQRLVHFVQTGRGRHRDLATAGVVLDSPGQLTQVEHHGSVGRGRPHVGVPTTARRDLEVVGSGECHRLLHVGRRRHGDDRRRRRTVVVGVENLLGRVELRVTRRQHLSADGGGKSAPGGGRRVGVRHDRAESTRSEELRPPLALRRRPAGTSGGISHAPTSDSRTWVTYRIVDRGETRTADDVSWSTERARTVTSPVVSRLEPCD